MVRRLKSSAEATVNLRDELAREFGGSWDGSEHHLHGLLERDGRKLKLEVTSRQGEYRCAGFARGACLVDTRASSAAEAVREAIDSIPPEDVPQT